MEIAVISDTHASGLENLPKIVIGALSRADLIVHAGDYTSKTLLDELRDLGQFRGVYGNMDSSKIKSELQEVEIFEAGKFKIGVTHPSDGGSSFDMETRVRKRFEQIDLIIYGHSHWARTVAIDGITYFNPGSATGKFPARYTSYGIIKINEEIDAKIVRV